MATAGQWGEVTWWIIVLTVWWLYHKKNQKKKSKIYKIEDVAKEFNIKLKK